MLHQFSTRRIVGLFLIDWWGSLGCLLAAYLARTGYGSLPAFLVNLLDPLQITVGSGGPGSSPVLAGWWALVPILALVTLIWPFFFIVFSIYDGRRNETLKIELRNVFQAIVVSMLVLSGSLFFTYRDTSRLTLFIFFILDSCLLLGSRILLKVYRLSTEGKRRQRKSVLVIGAGQVGKEAVAAMRHYAWMDINLVGFVDDDRTKQGQNTAALPVLGTLDQVEEVVAAYNITDAIVALPGSAHYRLVEVCQKLQQKMVRVHVIPDLFALSFPNAALEGFGGIPAIDLGQPGITGIQRMWKRVFDVIFALVSLVVISPLLAIIAILIKLDSRGAVLYKQIRIGENGQAFSMLKFRSMVTGSDHSMHKEHVTRLIKENIKPEQNGNGGSLKIEDDPRITRVGRFIRKTSLDELPQLINVLRGDMSLVGPRPCLPYEVECFQEWHKRRFEALPGITGLWQVEGRNRVSFDEMVRMDIDYIKNQSIGLDIKIIFQTPWAMLTARGAG